MSKKCPLASRFSARLLAVLMSFSMSSQYAIISYNGNLVKRLVLGPFSFLFERK
nr:MAG TPA: hypothetical protein [Caudoviricetes sp.]